MAGVLTAGRGDPRCRGIAAGAAPARSRLRGPDPRRKNTRWGGSGPQPSRGRPARTTGLSALLHRFPYHRLNHPSACGRRGDRTTPPGEGRAHRRDVAGRAVGGRGLGSSRQRQDRPRRSGPGACATPGSRRPVCRPGLPPQRCPLQRSRIVTSENHADLGGPWPPPRVSAQWPSWPCPSPGARHRGPPPAVTVARAISSAHHWADVAAGLREIHRFSSPTGS